MHNIAVPITALICLTIVEVVALLMGINGTLLLTVIGALSAIGGYTLKKVIDGSNSDST